MPKVVAARPQVLPYPRTAESSSSSKKLAGTKLFSEMHDTIQLVEATFLYAICPTAFLVGGFIGAAKPISDCYFKNVVPKTGDYQTNQEHFGQLVVMDQEINEYNEKHKNNGKKVGNEFAGINTYLFCKGVTTGLAYLLKDAFPVGCYSVVGLIGLKAGYSLAQRAVQWAGAPPKK